MKNNLIILLLINVCPILVLTNSLVNAEQTQDSISSVEFCNAGIYFFDKSKYAEADSCFKKAIELDSNNYWAKLYQIQTNDEKTDYNFVKQALLDYSDLIHSLLNMEKRTKSQDSILGIAYSGKASKLFLNDEKEKSLVNLDSSIIFFPDYKYNYDQRASLKRQLGDIQGAISDISALINMDTLWRNYYLTRSRLYQQVGEYLKEASDITMYMTVIPKVKDAFDPHNMCDDTTWRKPKTDYRYYRGIAYFNAKHYLEALADIEALMPTRDSLFIEGYYYIGYCKLYLGDTLGACATWNLGLEMDKSIEFRKYKSENNRKSNLKYYAEMNAEWKSKILIAIDKYCKKDSNLEE